MKLVTPTENLHARLGEFKALRLICESGFDGVDYSLFHLNGRDGDDCALNRPGYKEHIKRARGIIGEYGVTFEQAHAPFPSQLEKNVAYNTKMLDILKRSIEVAGLADAKMIVIHPAFYKHRSVEKNTAFFNKLMPYARDYGVKIAIENVWGCDRRSRIVPNIAGSRSDTMLKLLEGLDPRYFTVCIDVGHCGLVGEKPEDMIRALGGKTGCFHIHDNDNKQDLHNLPYTIKMDWDPILEAIADTGYSGCFTLEADRFFYNMPDELLPDAVRFMNTVGRNMIKRIGEMKERNG